MTLEEMQNICDKASPGPWNTINGASDTSEEHWPRWVGHGNDYPVLWAYGSNREANINFVSLARTEFPELIRKALNRKVFLVTKGVLFREQTIIGIYDSLRKAIDQVPEGWKPAGDKRYCDSIREEWLFIEEMEIE